MNTQRFTHMKYKIIILFFIISNYCFSQSRIEDYDKFKTEKIIYKADTINYHVLYPEKITKTTGIILFVHGSGAFPIYNVKKEDKNLWINSTIPFDLEKMPRDHIFVIVSKKCVPYLVLNEDYKPKKCFYENESLDYRVWQYNNVINHIVKTKIHKPKKIIAIGHSEGSDVVAKLGTINKKISHIGFWSGSGSSQYNDFALMIRKDVISGKITEEEGMKQLNELFSQLEKIENNPKAIEKFWLENSYKRWKNFSEPAIQNLLKINIPIFVVSGTKDEAVPVESSLLIKTEFIRNNKKNLTFRLYPNYDHNLELIKNNSQETEDKWMDVFNEFMEWTNR